MKRRAVQVLPFLVAGVLHVWASGEIAQDIVLFALALLSIPLGASVRLDATPVRALSAVAFTGGAILGWEHTPDAGFGAGTLPRAASSIAVGALLAAVCRLYVRDVPSRERAGFVLGVLAVGACGATRLGPGYAVLASAFLLSAFTALRSRDAARARASELGTRDRAALAVVVAVASCVALAFARAVPPLHRVMQRAFEQAYTPHDMVGYGAGAWLGSLRDVIRSDDEVLRIALPHDSRPMDYLRGGAYDEYRTVGFWDETPYAARLRDVPVVSELGRADTIRVRRLSGIANRYFVPLDGRDLRAGAGIVEVDDLGAVIAWQSTHARSWSFTLGDRDDLAPVAPRPTDLRVPHAEAAAITALAREWTVGADTAGAKLDAIQRHLQRDYRYSLDFVREADDPLLDFLLVHKEGYCTYFASALALAARAVGVPTRFVTGYRVAEWSPIAQEYIVRDKNAHAWVEAWVDGGWRTYDATPLVELAQDKPHVAPLGTLVADLARRIEHAAADAVAHATLRELLGLLVALLAAWVGVRALQRRAAVGSKPGTGDHFDPPLAFFERLAVSLAARGFAREPSEPLDRFARRLERSGHEDAARLVDRYAALRYGGIGHRATLEAEVERFLAPRSPV